MKRLFPRTLLIILPITALFLFSCVQPSCLEETNSDLKASFYNNNTKTLTAPDSVTAYGLNADTTWLYKKSTGIKTALLPLNASAGSCGFIIKINGITDTLQFYYSTYPHFISKECGYTFYHQVDSERHTSHAILEIYTANKTVTNLNGENIRIFY
jgi:hypothetical protein